MIAQALACDPQLLVADEPTTALDVTVQAEILKLMRDLRERVNAGIVLITHDMGVVADMADRIVVMKHGRIVESGHRRRRSSTTPQHPYTQQLLAAVPHLGAVSARGGRGRASDRRATPAAERSGDARATGAADPGGREPRPRVPQARQPARLPRRRRRLA